jgi:hypothetical protein
MYVYGGCGGRGNKVANKISTFSSQSDQLNFLPDFPPVFPEPCGGGGGGGGGREAEDGKNIVGVDSCETLSSHHSRGRTLGRNWDKSFQSFSSLLFTVTSTNGFYSLPFLSKSGLKLACNVNIAYGNFKINSQDYAQKPQQNCTYMNYRPYISKGIIIWLYLYWLNSFL